MAKTKRRIAERPPLTPAGKRAWAIFIKFCEGRHISRSEGRELIAEEMGIEPHYVMRDGMDDVEAEAFAHVCLDVQGKGADSSRK